MKYQVVFDRNGKVLSAGYHDVAGPALYDAETPRFGPVAGEGQRVAEIEVPEEFARLSLVELVERCRVDVGATRPRLVELGSAKGSARRPTTARTRPSRAPRAPRSSPPARRRR